MSVLMTCTNLMVLTRLLRLVFVLSLSGLLNCQQQILSVVGNSLPHSTIILEQATGFKVAYSYLRFTDVAVLSYTVTYATTRNRWSNYLKRGFVYPCASRSSLRKSDHLELLIQHAFARSLATRNQTLL
ncbi:hypothetical protein C7974DRAFT_57745 [Boeremia exigua]|uniref:uncharacterized protein n=1 Tax=Boeremia exigua TaxID=749465 RepID=UPI001E8D266A|nr:uncharacterized protein C7974DRAFT_57745 [Boeremia exigua]KAH6615044.1 hypothetical protein C7974DRAFT_57745 [Boeremia exigua]